MINFQPYDAFEYQRLLKKQADGEKLTEEEERYLRYCYHKEEAEAGLL